MPKKKRKKFPKQVRTLEKMAKKPLGTEVKKLLRSSLAQHGIWKNIATSHDQKTPNWWFSKGNPREIKGW